ncbi:Protein of unknown function [Kushneria avicenniae]|uniref:DUF3737 domain-containing protein n=2 Tax=Kushneria avicenniae TaxID=402385 RepID=A0A1I1G3K3_9GAMM|nr:Protein of unknown function [Kushneria avicenniae]
MKHIDNTAFGGERACFAAHDTRFEGVTFHPGESAIKHTHHVEAHHCRFTGKYPFWHNNDVLIENSLFTVDARAAIWYSSNVRMRDTRVEAPKMFRSLEGLTLERVTLSNAAECGWNCRNIDFRDVEIANGDYLLMNSQHIHIDGFRLQGNYSFQDARDVVIRNAHLDSRDALWNTRDVTVYDSVLEGEFLGWHSRNLRLVNCTIRGTQPLCYVTNLMMKNCVMEHTDLCFEYSTIDVDIVGSIDSIRNPAGGRIRADHIDEVFLDEHCLNPGACRIETRETEVPA